MASNDKHNDEDGFHSGISDEELDALLSGDIKSEKRPPKNLFLEDDELAEEQSEMLNELIASDDKAAETSDDEVQSYFFEADSSSPDQTSSMNVVDFDEDADVDLGKPTLTMSQFASPSSDESAAESTVATEELPQESDPSTLVQHEDSDVHELKTTVEGSIANEAPEEALSANLGQGEGALTPPAVVVTNNPSTAPSQVARASFTTSGKTTMSETQSAQIEQILAGIDELKRKLHGMNSDFYNAATDSATLISDIRELQVSTASGQDFSSTYEQSRELRKNLVSSRKAFNVLASAID